MLQNGININLTQCVCCYRCGKKELISTRNLVQTSANVNVSKHNNKQENKVKVKGLSRS